VTAIFPDGTVPEQWQSYIPLNYAAFGFKK